MIVLCPSCQTRFRHDLAMAAAHHAECSRCDERFPLAEARRTYVLIPGAVPRSGVGRPVGMDDPSLARQVGAGGEPEAPAAWSAPVPEGLRGSLVLLPAVVGAALGYLVASRQGSGVVVWAALGAALGLLVGWGCLRWIRPRP
jgi:hypothetical protein